MNIYNKCIKIIFILLFFSVLLFSCFNKKNGKEHLFETFLETNTPIIKNGDKFIIKLHIKNISGINQELDMNYFYNTSWYLDFYFVGKNKNLNNILSGRYKHSEKSLSLPIILKPLEEYIIDITAKYEYGDFFNNFENNNYRGMAIIFEEDDIYFPIKEENKIIKIIYRINDSVFIESNYIELKIN
jgi:hypothetical protein